MFSAKLRVGTLFGTYIGTMQQDYLLSGNKGIKLTRNKKQNNQQLLWIAE